MKIIYLSLLITLISTATIAQKEIKSYPLSEKITIDGELSEAIWKNHLQFGDFKQIEPNNGQKASQKTKIAITNDGTYLYVAAEIFSNKISKPLTARDNSDASDYFGILLDPFGANREGWAFLITPANVQIDIKLTESNNYGEWNAVWESAVKIYKNKWTVEFKIPFNSLRFPKENLENFSINFERFDAATNEDSFWNFVNADIDGFLNQFGKLKGIKNVNPPINLSFFPFTSFVYEKNPNGDSKNSFNGGLDVKYVYKNAYTLDISTIPDFSLAPSDDEVLNLSPFEIKFDENRQFFVEGTEIFDKGNYVYTRKIGGKPINKNNISLQSNEEIIENPVASNILNLIKFTGKSENGLSIGVLNGITDKSEATIVNTTTNTSRKAVTNPLTNYNSIVIDKTLKNNSSITFINNSVLRSGTTYDANLTALLLKLYNKKRTYSFNFRKAISQKYISDTENSFGHQYFGAFSKISGKWTGTLLASLQDQNYDNNDFGFNNRNNKLTYFASIKYSKNKVKDIFSSYNISLRHFERYYYSLRQKERSFYEIKFFGRRKNNHNIFTEFRFDNKRKDFYEARVTDRVFNKPASFSSFFEYQTNRTKKVSFAGYFGYQKFFDSAIFTDEIYFGFGLYSRFGEHLSVNISHSFENTANEVGYLTTLNSNIIFGQRNIQQLTNKLNIAYTVNSKMSITASVRHYWIQVGYKNQFTLLQSGDLATNNYAINAADSNANFNRFNIDFLAKWQFAPASEMSLGYKMGANYFDTDVDSNYGSNFKNTFNEKKSHTISLKITYLIDFNRFKNKTS